MELLAPAGDFACLEAAVDAGADAVYLGLSTLNARRSAHNFTPEELAGAVEFCHGRGVKLHLTLNIDITRRETGTAARVLAFARDAGVDAVIIRDMALIRLWQALSRDSAEKGLSWPTLHFSTQTAITNVEGARMAAGLGAKRVILARELALAEIREIRAASGLEVEVFAQGALCYSISGRCLLSSWGGGRSGNRGMCTSPCRVPWAVDGESVGAAMSMRDLVTVDRLKELKDAGVRSLKIEGRLKKPEWVAEAVGLYRHALDASKTKIIPRATKEEAETARRLAAYAGRDVTSNYLDGNFRDLTGAAGRKAAGVPVQSAGAAAPDGGTRGEKGAADTYAIAVNVSDKGVSCRCSYKGKSESWRMPRTRIKRENKAVSVTELFAMLDGADFAGVKLGGRESNAPDFMLPPRNVKAVFASVAAFVNRLAKAKSSPEAKLNLPLPMRECLEVGEPSKANCRTLGEMPNQARLTVKQLNTTLLPALRDVHAILQDVEPRDMDFIAKMADLGNVTFAFPQVYFPADAAKAEELAAICRREGIKAEANCWGSLHICRRHGLNFSAGPGLAVLNHLAAACLMELGASSATVSMEADKEQIEDISAASPLPLSLVIYAQPILAFTRIPRDDLLPDHDGDVINADGQWTDRRGMRLKVERISSVTVFRSLQSFNWSRLRNKKIRAANLVADLTGTSYPLDTWKNLRANRPEEFLFNYMRGLK